MTTVTIWKATETDIPELVRQRRLMFESMGFEDSHKLHSTSQLPSKFFLE